MKRTIETLFTGLCLQIVGIGQIVVAVWFGWILFTQDLPGWKAAAIGIIGILGLLLGLFVTYLIGDDVQAAADSDETRRNVR